MALFDDLQVKSSKTDRKTIEKSSELADVAKTRVSIKSAQADLDEKFIELANCIMKLLVMIIFLMKRQQQSFRN